MSQYPPQQPPDPGTGGYRQEYPPGEGPGAEPRRKRSFIPMVLAAVVVAALVALGVIALTGDDSDDPITPGTPVVTTAPPATTAAPPSTAGSSSTLGP